MRWGVNDIRHDMSSRKNGKSYFTVVLVIFSFAFLFLTTFKNKSMIIRRNSKIRLPFFQINDMLLLNG